MEALDHHPGVGVEEGKAQVDEAQIFRRQLREISAGICLHLLQELLEVTRGVSSSGCAGGDLGQSLGCEEEDEGLEMADSLSCLSFEQTIPSKFMMGTNQGNVISCRLSPKQGTNSQLLASWKKVGSSVIF